MKLSEAVFAIVDTETTGLVPAQGDALVEIGAWYWRFNTGLVGRPYATLVHPQRDIPWAASAIHHITDRDVVDAPSPALALTQLDRFIGSEIVCVAHNAEFDRQFLPVLETRRWLCSKRFAQHVFPDAPAYNNQVLRYMFGGADIDLLGESPHRSTADVIVTAFNMGHIVAKYLETHEDDLDAAIALAASPILFSKMPNFGKHAGQSFEKIPKSYLRWMIETLSDPDLKYTAEVHLDGSQRLFGAA